jgi:hypothetical protein
MGQMKAVSCKMQLPHILQLKSALLTQRSKVVNARMGTESRCTGMNGDWDLRGEKMDIFVSWRLIGVLYSEKCHAAERLPCYVP